MVVHIEIVGHLLGNHPNRVVIRVTTVHIGSLLFNMMLESLQLLDVVLIVQCVFDLDEIVIVLEETEEHFELGVRYGVVPDVQL